VPNTKSLATHRVFIVESESTGFVRRTGSAVDNSVAPIALNEAGGNSERRLRSRDSNSGVLASFASTSAIASRDVLFLVLVIDLH
jgi:hypothetical protein